MELSEAKKRYKDGLEKARQQERKKTACYNCKFQKRRRGFTIFVEEVIKCSVTNEKLVNYGYDSTFRSTQLEKAEQCKYFTNKYIQGEIEYE